MSDKIILAYALSLVSKKEYSSRELLAKLNKKFVQREQDVEAVMSECRQHKYVDDARYALAFIRKRQRVTGRPAWVVEQELKKAGISADTAAAARAAPEWSDVAVARGYLATKKSRWASLPVAEQRTKQKQLLQQHGFSWEVIDQVVSR